METETTREIDVLFEILADEHRRQALYYLRSFSGPVQLRDLARRVVELAPSEESAGADRRREVFTRFHQCHCPKMKAAGLIEFDPTSKMVMLGTVTAEADACLSLAARYETATA